MATHPPPVLDPDDLNETDEKILDLLREGRVTPPYVSKELDLSREYASERLIRMYEHDNADRPAPGLYELIDDPHGERGGVDLDAVRRCVENLEAAFERGDRPEIQERMKALEEALDDA